MASHVPPRSPNNISDLFGSLPRLLTVRQVCEELQISKRHAHRLMASGALRTVKLCPTERGAVRIPRDALVAFLQRSAA